MDIAVTPEKETPNAPTSEEIYAHNATQEIYQAQTKAGNR